MRKHKVSAIPVVDSKDHPVGMVTSSDLLDELADGAPVSSFMSDSVLSVPEYDQPHVAARIMRNHKIHHLVVTDSDKKVTGIVSAFDLLCLVEDHRFVIKQGPTKSKKKKNKKE